MGRTGIGPFDDQRLQMFNDLIFAAWGEVGYQVGSSLKGKEWRDVDIRVMLSKDEYARHFGSVWQNGMRHQDPRWRAEMQAWDSALAELAKLRGLIESIIGDIKELRAALGERSTSEGAGSRVADMPVAVPDLEKVREGMDKYARLHRPDAAAEEGAR